MDMLCTPIYGTDIYIYYIILYIYIYILHRENEYKYVQIPLQSSTSISLYNYLYQYNIQYYVLCLCIILYIIVSMFSAQGRFEFRVLNQYHVCRKHHGLATDILSLAVFGSGLCPRLLQQISEIGIVLERNTNGQLMGSSEWLGAMKIQQLMTIVSGCQGKAASQIIP